MISSDYDGLVAATRATLERIASDFTPAVFASSLAAEDMVLTDLILRANEPHEVIHIDRAVRLTVHAIAQKDIAASGGARAVLGDDHLVVAALSHNRLL